MMQEIDGQFQQLQGQLGVYSPSLGSFGSPALRGMPSYTVKTNSTLSRQQIKSSDPIREVINERPVDDQSYERRVFVQTKSVVPSKESSFRLPPVSSQYQSPRSSIPPSKLRPEARKRNDGLTTATGCDENSEVMKIDTRLLMRGSARAAHMAMKALLDFFINEKEKKACRMGSCMTRGCRGEKPETVASVQRAELTKQTRLRQAKKYFDFNEIKTLSSAQAKWDKQHGGVVLPSTQSTPRRVDLVPPRPPQIPEEVKERRSNPREEVSSSAFRRTSAPPKVRTGEQKYNLDPLIRGGGGQTVAWGEEEEVKRAPRRKDELDTLMIQERHEPATECTMPRSQFMRQLSPSEQSKNLASFPRDTNRLDKTLSSIHSSHGKGSEPSLSKARPPFARFAENKRGGAVQSLVSPRFGGQDVLSPSSRVLLEQPACLRGSEARAADVLDIMRKGGKYKTVGTPQSHASFASRRDSPCMRSGEALRRSAQPAKAFNTTSGRGGVLDVKKGGSRYEDSAATKRQEPPPLSQTIDLSSAEGSGVAKTVYSAVVRHSNDVTGKFVAGRGLAGVVGRK